MILHRPHRGSLAESMKEAREFTSLKECIETLIKEHNELCPVFNVTMEDIVIAPYGSDDRVGWDDMFMICCVPYFEVRDKDGYIKFYGGQYNHNLQLFGMFTTCWS